MPRQRPFEAEVLVMEQDKLVARRDKYPSLGLGAVAPGKKVDLGDGVRGEEARLHHLERWRAESAAAWQVLVCLGTGSLIIWKPSEGIRVIPASVQSARYRLTASCTNSSSTSVTMTQSAIPRLSFQQAFENVCSERTKESGSVRWNLLRVDLGMNAKQL